MKSLLAQAARLLCFGMLLGTYPAILSAQTQTCVPSVKSRCVNDCAIRCGDNGQCIFGCEVGQDFSVDRCYSDCNGFSPSCLTSCLQTVDCIARECSGGIIVKPGDQPVTNPPTPATINSKSNGKTPVAILSRQDFNAPSVIDPATLTFGETGNEKSFAFCSGATDVNGDGLPDLICHFNTPLLALKPTDKFVILKAKTKKDSNGNVSTLFYEAPVNVIK